MNQYLLNMDYPRFSATPFSPLGAYSPFNCPISYSPFHPHHISSAPVLSSSSVLSGIHPSSSINRTPYSSHSLIQYPSFSSRYISSNESVDPDHELYTPQEVDLPAEVYNLYGVLGIITWENIKDIFPYLTQARTIPSRLIQKYISENEYHRYDLVARLPSLSDILDNMNNEDDWSSLLVKLLLDIYNDYLIRYDGPIYSVYLNNFLPVVMYFYAQIESVVCLNFRTRVMKRSLEGRDVKDLVTVMNDCEEYLEHFRMKGRDIERLTEGMTEDEFFV